MCSNMYTNSGRNHAAKKAANPVSLHSAGLRTSPVVLRLQEDLTVMKKLQILVFLLVFAPLGLFSEQAHSAEEPVTKTLVWPDGTRYVGGVVAGKRTGKGTIFWQDGTRFVGQFENDMRNGPGTMILPDGTVYTGFFKDDELIDTQSTIAASSATEPVELNAEDSAAALGDTQLPIEADSIVSRQARAPTNTDPADEHDLIEPVEAEPEPKPEPEPEPEPEPIIADEPSVDEPEPFAVHEPAPVTRVEDEGLDDPYSTDVTEITETVKNELIETIDLWAAAWSDQNVTQYLTHYHDDFVIPGRQSRRTWEALRRTRLNRPRYIKLDVVYERFELVEPNVIDVFFRQSYRSNTYTDLTEKVLRMRKADTDWKILAERSQ